MQRNSFLAGAVEDDIVRMLTVTLVLRDSRRWWWQLSKEMEGEPTKGLVFKCKVRGEEQVCIEEEEEEEREDGNIVDGPRRKYCRAGVWGEEAGRRDRLRVEGSLIGIVGWCTE